VINVPTVQKEKKDRGENPFSKTFSEEMQAHFEGIVSLYNQWNRLVSSRNIALYPETSTAKFLAASDAYIERLGATKTQDRIDGILITELQERAEIMKLEMELPTYKKFDYEKLIRCFGISSNDVKGLEQHFRAINYNEVAERWISINGESYTSKPESSDRELSRLKDIYQKLLRASYGIASSDSKESFPDFDSYMASIQFINNREGGSYQSSDKVFYNLYDTQMMNIRDGLRYRKVVDVFNASDLIGEEGLLGHQGQFLVNEKANIPHFLKQYFNPATTINAETLGNVGSLRMVRMLESNPLIIDGIADKDFEFLKARFNTNSENGSVNRFMRGYESYAYFENDRDAKRTAAVINSIVKTPVVTSEEFTNSIGTYYNSNEFWKNPRKDLKVWAYLFADLMTEKIGNTLDVLEGVSANKILDNLQIGFWTKKGFEQYFDYLVERFG
jgi:hypothetical protein